MSTAGILLGASAIVLTGTAAVKDACTGHIPNRLTLGALLIIPLGRFLDGYLSQGAHAGIAALGASALGILCTGLIPLALFERGDIGGGDVKLLAATGALLGPFAGFNALAAGLTFASVFALIRAAWRGQLRSTLLGTLGLRYGSVSKTIEAQRFARQTLRLGPALCAGTVVAVLGGPYALIPW